MSSYKRTAAWLRMHGRLRPGRGRVSGSVALALGVLALLAVLAFHYPEYLTTPELRQKYQVPLLRQILFYSLVLSGGLSLANILLGRSRWLSSTAFACVALAALWGGHKVPVGDFPDGTPYIGLDWFILDLLGSTLLFVFLEKLFPLYRDQPVFRRDWQTDLMHFLVNHLLVGVVLMIVNYLVHRFFGWAVVTPDFHHWHHSSERAAIDRNYAAHFSFLDFLFGTAVKADTPYPSRYGVLGDYMPKGFVRQQLFPFRGK